MKTIYQHHISKKQWTPILFCYIAGLSHSVSKIGVYLYHDSRSFITNSTIHKGCRMQNKEAFWYTTFYEDKKVSTLLAQTQNFSEKVFCFIYLIIKSRLCVICISSKRNIYNYFCVTKTAKLTIQFMLTVEKVDKWQNQSAPKPN